MNFCPQAVAWGTVGEWAGALAAAVPLIFWAFERRERKSAQEELQTKERLAADERLSAQAGRVVFWSPAVKELTVRNASDLPISDVRLFRRVPASDGNHTFAEVADWPLVPPNEDMKVRDATHGQGGQLALKFSDSGGRDWERGEDGRLSRLWTVVPRND